MEKFDSNGEILSFVELLDKHKIEIPIIQRDYAQGRKEHTDIRQKFLQSLKSSIIGNKTIKLDFIYGEIVDDAFQPLDGQQRLTTLFLLHWYAIAKEGDIPENIVQLLSKFKYETKLSSGYFCKSLVSDQIELDNYKKVSDAIRDSNWFYLSWDQDPSIMAMLNTLDDIKDYFHDISDLWVRLTERKLITFHYLNLQDLGLSDDLYIKMNARGKLLTPFENFKAQMQMTIKKEGWEARYSVINKFEHKMDTEWTELFWGKFDKDIDKAHIKFISAVVMFKIALNKGKPVEQERKEVLGQMNDNSDGKYLLKFIDKEVYNYIYECYEIFTRVEADNIDLNISEINFWTHNCKDGKSILEETFSNPSYTKKVLLFAQIEFIRRNKNFSRKAYINWMRIIRNFVCFDNITIKSNSSRSETLRSPESFEGMINLINEMAEGCEDIYKYLASDPHNIRGSRRNVQMREEVDKAKKIMDNPEINEIIWKLEDLNIFRGRISFALDCVSEVFADRVVSEENKLEMIYKIFHKYYEDENFAYDLFNRVMLTIDVDGEYKYYDYWISRWHIIDAAKRKFVCDLTDLNYLIYNKRKIYEEMGDNEKYFLKLISILLEKENQLEEVSQPEVYYKNIIDDFIVPNDMPTWKKKLIKEPAWIKEHKSGFFAITDDDEKCYLLKSQKPFSLDGSKIVE